MEIDDATSIDTVEGWDSLRHILLVNAIEHEFGCRFDNSSLVRLRSVGDIRRLLAAPGADGGKAGE